MLYLSFMCVFVGEKQHYLGEGLSFSDEPFADLKLLIQHHGAAAAAL